MSAKSSLPVASSQPKVISGRACEAMLRSLVDSFEVEAFVPFVGRIAKLAGATYVGPQSTDGDTLHFFREPVTGTTVSVWDLDLSLEALQASMKAARTRFGVA